jgi:hypothetical protein
VGAAAVRYDEHLVRRSLATILVHAGCLIDNPAWLGPPGSDSGASTESDGESSSGGDAPSIVGCDPRPAPPVDAIVVAPDEASELGDRIAAAAPGATILLADGTFDLEAFAPVVVGVPGLVLRSQSGDASAVVLDGGASSVAILDVRASGVEISELSLTGGASGAIAFAPDAHDGLVYGVDAQDVGGPAIYAAADLGTGRFVDRGEVACSTFTRTLAAEPGLCEQLSAVRVLSGEGWTVRNNLIEGYRCTDPVNVPAAIGLRNGARDSEVVRNTFRNCARPLLLGNELDGTERAWPDAPCDLVDGWGHVGGTIGSNVIWVGDAAVGPDSMISVWNACDALVLHNSIVLLGDGFHGIEHRFDRTSVTIVNNLTNADIAARDGSLAIEEGNLQGASLDDFVDAFGGDLHIVSGAAAVDAGLASLGGIDPGPDIDGQPRDASPDVGADELK